MFVIININLIIKFFLTNFRIRTFDKTVKIFSSCDGRKYFLRERGRRGVTLVELMTVLVILGISTGMFYTVWFSNWKSFEQHTTIADLWFDANEIEKAMSMDGRAASLITVSLDQKSVDFTNVLGTIFSHYQMTSGGDFIITKGAATTTVTDRVDFTNSFFIQKGSSLQADLTLADNQAFGGAISINSQMEVFPRN